MSLLKPFSRAWILTTLLVLAGTALCIRLGIWQLDRLEQRRAHNTQVITMRAKPPLDLNQGIPEDITGMEWRAVRVTGEYDLENQFALRNQTRGNEYGYHLIAPLKFNGGAILVDRGFIPAEGNDTPANWSRYDERGAVTVAGQLRLGDDVEIGGNSEARTGKQDQLRFWNSVELQGISAQLPYPVLQVYIQPGMDAADEAYPIPYQPEVDLTEGSHFGYALQWFTFAAILFFGYPFYLSKQTSAESKAA